MTLFGATFGYTTIKLKNINEHNAFTSLVFGQSSPLSGWTFSIGTMKQQQTNKHITMQTKRIQLGGRQENPLSLQTTTKMVTKHVHQK